MKIQDEKEGKVTIVSLQGSLDPDQALVLKDRLHALFNEGTGHMVMDLSKLDYTGSAGLREFFFASKSAEQAGGKLLLCGLKNEVKETFEIAGFIKPENIFDSRESALAELS